MLGRDVDFYVINHDGLFSMEKELAARPDIDLIIIDEVSMYRNSQTRRWKVANKLFRSRKRMWGLTGTPTPNAPTDAFGQMKLIAPERAPRFFKQFQAETMIQITSFKWVAKKNANDVVFDYMQPAVRYTRDDCYDLPACMTVTLEVEMSAKAKKAYSQLMRELHLQWAEGEVTAVNEGVKMSKLLQVGAGYVYTVDGGVIDVDAAPRLKELERVINEAAGKVIVFMAFKFAVDKVYDYLLKQGLSVAKIYGDTPKGQRDKIFNSFQNDADPKILVAHPGCMSHGLNLHEANTIVWYTPVTSTETYLQANARITRPGQTRHQFIVHIESSPVEKKVFRKLKNNERVQNILLDMFGGTTL